MNTTEVYAVLSRKQMKYSRERHMKALNATDKKQKYLFLKCGREHAEQIAQQLTAKQYGAAYVVRLSLKNSFLSQLENSTIAYEAHKDYRVPTRQLPRLHWYLSGSLKVVSVYWCHEPEEQLDFASF